MTQCMPLFYHSQCIPPSAKRHLIAESVRTIKSLGEAKE